MERNKISNFYCLPILGRAGLGNKLFPWARAIVCARINGLEILSPKWWHVPIGPFIRKEPMKRLYFDLLTNNGYVKGIRKAMVLLSSIVITEEEFFSEINNPYFHQKLKGRSVIITFSEPKNCFYALKNEHYFIKQELIRITHPKWLKAYKRFNAKCIVLHVRRGDSVNDFHYTPLDWFIRIIERLREEDFLRELPVRVFSDGHPRDLEPILDMSNVQRVYLGSAIADLLAISRASILVASGISTFSSWASFLGRMPTIYYPGEMRLKLFEENKNIYEGEFDPQNDEFPDLLRQNINMIKSQR